MSKVDYINRRLKEEKDSAALLKRCGVLRQEFQVGKLNVNPQWWTDLKKIKLKGDKEYLRPERMVIIENISISKLIEKIISENSAILKQRQLFHDKLDSVKTCKIIDHWKSGEKLIPPTIIWSSYYDTVEMDDGRHRLNAAICLGERSVPIMTSVFERDIVLHIWV